MPCWREKALASGWSRPKVIARFFRWRAHTCRGGLAGWIVWPKPEPLAALDDTVEVRKRIGARGEVVSELDEASAREALRKLKRRAVEAVTVSLINAYANPAHERRIREIAKEEALELPLSLSSEILSEMREYDRTITTVA